MTTGADFCHTLEINMPVTLGSVNVYLIPTARGGALIDTGMYTPESLTALEVRLSAHNLHLDDIHTVLVTHYHPDHCGLAAAAQQHGARVLISRVDADVMHDYFTWPHKDADRIAFHGRHLTPDDPQDRIGGMSRLLRSFHCPFTPDATFENGASFVLGDVTLTARLTPGHTPGHAVFVCPEHQVVFTGDHLIEDQISLISTREAEVSHDALGDMLDSLGAMAPFADWKGLSGHGEPIADVGLRANQTARFHRARLTRLADSLGDTPDNALDISNRVFGEKKRLYSRWLSLSSTITALEHLVATGVAQVTRSSEGLVRYSRNP